MPQDQRDPQDLARDVALSVASDPSEVGDFIGSSEGEDGVSEFRFASLIKGYEGWLWSVTLFHDAELDRWTVDESSLVPGSDAILPPAWVPWKDRLLPSDLSVTDAMGTEKDDPRLEPGLQPGDKGYESAAQDESESQGNQKDAEQTVQGSQELVDAGGAIFKKAGDQPDQADERSDQGEQDEAERDWLRASKQDLDSAVERFALTRRHVLSPLGRAQTAKRWYEGQRGPKSLSTRTAKGATCASCGFMIPIQGELGTMFGVCANRWSPDDGKVVALDHGCGEHSEIDPPQAPPLWVQSAPAFDDLHIDVVRQAPREERPEVELIEQISNEGPEEAEDDAQESPHSEPETVRRRRRTKRQ
ncbi:DUF3027 domain-containing protein [Bifidobacterium actinocoloniiforme]|nr:DUF3027 domain-containing protein [Bifidobacterium actinocoloniiforme]